MPLTPELEAAYTLAARPYKEADGPIPADVLGLKSWRYLIELNTACNLRCAMCINGADNGYQRHTGNGLMNMAMLEQVLDKIKSENPNCILCPYGNGEPFLHPQLPECIQAIKRRGFRCELATNLHYTNRLDEVIASGPDIIIISVSGFTQETFSKSHRGGDIERVKKNIQTISEVRNNIAPNLQVAVSYHMYNDNLHEVQLMDEYVKSLGLFFMVSWARTISLENTVQAMRHLERQRGGFVPDFPIGTDGHDWNKALPPAHPDFLQGMERLRFPPVRAHAMYARWPEAPVCLIGDVFTYIRHDGKVALCAWIDDRRLQLGNYLEMTQDQISAARRGHGFCRECLRYRLNLYYHVVDCTKWDSGGIA